MKFALLALAVIGSSALGMQAPQQPESPFQIAVKHTATGIELSCESGCAWKTLTFACAAGEKECTARVDDHGLIVDQGGVHHVGEAGLTQPVLVHEVRPAYTPEAMARKIAGTVVLQCVVGVDGKVSDVRFIRSLDSLYGLDQQAFNAASQWEFRPGMKDGHAVPVMITLEMSFAVGK